jgi:Rod binding domain-containing protein
MDVLPPTTSTVLPGAEQQAQADRLQGRATAAAALPAQAKAQEYWKVAEGFEQIFLNFMLSSMRKTTMENGLLGDDNNEAHIYRSMFDQQIAAEMSKRRDFGLGHIIFNSNAEAARAYRDHM